MSKISQLSSQLLEAKRLYYTTGTSPLSDPEYDALEAELRALNPDNAILAMVGYQAPDASAWSLAEYGYVEDHKLMDRPWLTVGDMLRLKRYLATQPGYGPHGETRYPWIKTKGKT